MMPGDERKSASDLMVELITAVAESHDKAAFQAIFDHFAPRVKAFTLRHGASPELAEEVAQETMIKVWRKADQFDASKATLSTWVFTIARNLRIDMLRKSARLQPDPNDPALVPNPEPQSDDLISRDQEAKILKDIVALLPDEQQDVLKLAFFEDLAHAQVSERLGIPLGTVKSRIRLAFKRIRSELGERQ